MNRVLAIVGPTGCGKTDVAMRVVASRAERDGSPVEIVAVDAFTIYRGMDIGTAKPSAADLAAVRHHLVDVLEPSDDVTVAWFQQAARDAIAGIHARGHDALLVGGSGLYFRAVVDDLRFPPTDAALRARIEARWDGDPDGAFALLRALDPVAAERMAPENIRRTIRALEVIELTGEKFSDSDRMRDYQSIFDGLEVAYLEPERAVLRARIAARAAKMVEAGLLAEAEALRSAGPLSSTAAQAIGYREAFNVLDGTADGNRLADLISTRHWQYAKRQQGWFRRDPRCAVVDGASVVEAFS